MAQQESTEKGGRMNPLTGLSYSTKRHLKNVSLGSVTLLASLVFLFPLLWMAITAFRPENMIYQKPTPILPTAPTLENFRAVIFSSTFPRYYINTVIVTTGVVILNTTIATLGGYGLTRIDIPYKRSFARLILFGYMFPAILLAIPMYIIWFELGILNSHLGLILALVATALPFSLWIMWKFFQTVPISQEESAFTCGATRFQALYEIALPQAKSGIIAVGLFSYAIGWNSYTLPRIIVPNNENWVITLGLNIFTYQGGINWGELMAANTLAMIPSIIFVYSLQRYLLRGFENA